MLPHAINGVLPDFSGLSDKKMKIPVLIEEKTLPVGTTSIEFTGLNGDEDIEYILEGKITTSGIANDTPIQLKPNNLATNQGSTCHYFIHNNHNSYGNLTYLLLARQHTTATFQMTILSRLLAKTGQIRVLKSSANIVVSNLSYYGQFDYAGFWTDTTTNITSLVISVGSGSISGIIKLYKLVEITLEDLTPT